MRFSAQIRYWNPDKASGLAVVDLPDELVRFLGGLKQQKVRGTINGLPYESNVMPAGGGRLALSVSRKMMTEAAAGVGSEAEFELERR